MRPLNRNLRQHKIAVKTAVNLIHQHTFSIGFLPLMMVVYKGWHGADLHSVSVISGVFKQSIVWIKKFTGNQEKELSGWTTIIQPKKKNI